MDVTGLAITIALLLGPAPGRAVESRPVPVIESRPAQSKIDPGPELGASDPWLGDDKYRHFLLSFGGTVLAYGAARSLTDADAAAVVALGAGALGGLAKEVLDRRAGRVFSLRDLAWDALGLLAAWSVVRNTR